MSRENVELVRASYKAWSDDDLDAWLEMCDPEVELLTSGYFPDFAPTYRGHDGMRTFWEEMRTPWEWFQIHPERIVEGEDCAAVAVRFRAQGKGSGVITDLQQGHVVCFKHGRAVRVSTHQSFEQALEAVRLSGENVESVYRAYDALRRHDKEAFVRELHPDVEGVLYVMEAEGVVCRGHSDMHRFLDELFSVFPDWHPEVVQATDYGGTVLFAEIRMAGQGARSGVALEQTIWQVIKVRDGKAVWFRGYGDRAEALEAVGLPQQADSVSAD